jgi:hypothetical protein
MENKKMLEDPNGKVPELKNSLTHVPFFEAVEETVKGRTEEETIQNYDLYFGVKRKKKHSEEEHKELPQEMGQIPKKFIANEQENIILPEIMNPSDILQNHHLSGVSWAATSG